MVVITKSPKKCKYCGMIGHSATFCYYRPRKRIPVKSKIISRNKPIRRLGKTGKKWLLCRAQWFDENPADFYNCFYCQAIGINECLSRREATLDHWHSRTRRPDLIIDKSNLVVACYHHNREKGSRDGAEYLSEILTNKYCS